MHDAHVALNRFGLGARPGEAAALGDVGAWFEAQLSGDASLEVPGAPDRAAGVAALAASREPGTEAAESMRDAARKGLRLELEARLGRALTTPHGFTERLVAFWSNHFTVAATKAQVVPFVGLHEREAIRPHLFGRFADLLRAAVRHPAMLLYLDQAQSFGPTSRVGRRRGLGLNENLAREILELHTLGVDGGYTQDDVLGLARGLTGLTVSSPRFDALVEAPHGEVVFIDALHEPGAHALLGQAYADDGAAQAEAMLVAVAAHPATARHLATKLARHFIADDPPAPAVEALEAAWLASGGDLVAVYRALIARPEAWPASPTKHKAPVDFVVSALRAVDVREPPMAIVQALVDMGQPPARAPSPKGWPDVASAWTGPDALLRRVEWAQQIARRVPVEDVAERLADVLGPWLHADTLTAVRRAASRAQALTLGLASPEFLTR